MKLSRVRFVDAVIDPGARGLSFSSGFGRDHYDLTLDTQTGLVSITSRETSRMVQANVPCCWEALPSQAAPSAVPPVAPAAESKRGKR